MLGKIFYHIGNSFKKKEQIGTFKNNIYQKEQIGAIFHNIGNSLGLEGNIFTDLNNRLVTRNKTKFEFVISAFISVFFSIYFGEHCSSTGHNEFHVLNQMDVRTEQCP